MAGKKSKTADTAGDRARDAFVGGIMGVDGSKPPGLKVLNMRMGFATSESGKRQVKLTIEYKVDDNKNKVEGVQACEGTALDADKMLDAYINLGRRLGGQARTEWRKAVER